MITWLIRPRSAEGAEENTIDKANMTKLQRDRNKLKLDELSYKAKEIVLSPSYSLASMYTKEYETLNNRLITISNQISSIKRRDKQPHGEIRGY